jgi:hypothetical protein
VRAATRSHYEAEGREEEGADVRLERFGSWYYLSAAAEDSRREASLLVDMIVQAAARFSLRLISLWMTPSPRDG